MASLVADSPMVSSVSEEKDVVVYAVRVSYYLDRKLYHNSRICILEKVKKKFFFLFAKDSILQFHYLPACKLDFCFYLKFLLPLFQSLHQFSLPEGN